MTAVLAPSSETVGASAVSGCPSTGEGASASWRHSPSMLSFFGIDIVVVIAEKRDLRSLLHVPKNTEIGASRLVEYV